MDACRALAGCGRERPLSRGEPWDGMAARSFSRADGKEFARAHDSALAAHDGPSAGNAPGDPSLHIVDRPCRMAAPDPDWRQPPGHRVWCLPVRQSASSQDAGADTTDATWAVVLRCGDCSWRRIDDRANLSGALPSR